MEQASAKKTETTAEPVDPPLSRFDVRQAFDLIDLLSSFGVARAFASPAARSRQSLTPWASMGGGSVTLVESLDLTASGPDAQVDAVQCPEVTETLGHALDDDGIHTGRGGYAGPGGRGCCALRPGGRPAVCCGHFSCASLSWRMRRSSGWSSSRKSATPYSSASDTSFLGGLCTASGLPA